MRRSMRRQGKGAQGAHPRCLRERDEGVCWMSAKRELSPTGDREAELVASDTAAASLIDLPILAREADCFGVHDLDAADRQIVVRDQSGRRIGVVRPGQRASFV